MMRRLAGTILSAEALGLILVVAALRLFPVGISASLQDRDAPSFFWFSLPAALLAFGMRKGRLNGIGAWAALLGLGVVGVWIIGARLLRPLLDLTAATLDVISQLGPAFRANVAIDTSAVMDAWYAVTQSSSVLSQRVELWLQGMDRNLAEGDVLVRSMIWLLLIWLLSAWVGWFAARRDAVTALLPSIFLLAAMSSYSGRGVGTLWAMVFLLLLLMGIWNYRSHIIHWERKRVDYSDSIPYDVSQAVVFLTLALGLLALMMPSVSWRQFREYLRQGNRNELAEVLGVEQEQLPVQKSPGPQPSLPREHLLSPGAAQSEEVVMIIRTGELPAVAGLAIPQDPPRYYWRSTIYDFYMGTGWVASGVRSQDVPADTPLLPGLLNGYKALHLDVERRQPEGKLFWSGILFSADVPVRADWRVRPQANLFADQSTLLEADLFAAASGAERYQVQSYVPLTTVDKLRRAVDLYPEEIQMRYLKLPASVPERVRKLAAEITKDQPTAYDKAKAIEAYLRTYPYDLDIPAPPQDRDVADYFLFDLRKGYCDYYATTMVILARASGLPARFVSGYATGFYDAASAQYVVRELHAHSWPEVFFPGVGWIEFEPTAAQPIHELPQQDQAANTAPPDPGAARLLYRFRLESVLYWLSPLGAILFLSVLYFAVLERWSYLRLEPGPAVERVYRRLYRWGRPLAGTRAGAETPQEFMQKLVQRINPLPERSGFRRLFSPAAGDIELLTNLYQVTLFTRNEVKKRDVHRAVSAWKRLRVRLLFARVSLSLRQFAHVAGQRR